MAAPADRDRDVVLGHASALRILKTCLFHPPLQTLAMGGGRGRVFVGRNGGWAKTEGEVNLVPRALPPIAPPCSAARSAMNVPDTDLQQLLDKLVLVRGEGAVVYVKPLRFVDLQRPSSLFLSWPDEDRPMFDPGEY